MTDEEKEMYKAYKEEVEKCFEIAQKLDSCNPQIKGSFTGTPSERIKRHILFLCDMCV